MRDAWTPGKPTRAGSFWLLVDGHELQRVKVIERYSVVVGGPALYVTGRHATWLSGYMTKTPHSFAHCPRVAGKPAPRFSVFAAKRTG